MANRSLAVTVDEACRNISSALEFAGFLFAGKEMLETPSQKALEEHRRRILARHGL
jgi:hypothetical protein